MKMRIVGVDEAGRGSLAGPVVVAAVAVPAGFKCPRAGRLPKLKDSKRLSPLGRDLWYRYLIGNKEIFLYSSRVYQKRIDGINVTRSANIAASCAVEGVARSLGKSPKNFKILLDGGMRLGRAGHEGLNAQTVTRGDQRVTAIKLASVVAKVVRDKYMKKLHRRYPEYGFGKHKGYGTKVHFGALRKYGISEVHRLTYLTGYPNLKPRKR